MNGQHVVFKKCIVMCMEQDILNWCLKHQKQRRASGYIILGPPGIGKTTFVGEHPHTWIDIITFSDLGIHTVAFESAYSF